MRKKMSSAPILLLGLMIVGCSDSPTPADRGQKAKEIYPGEYYSFVSLEGDYKVLKVLLVEEKIVHFCYYNNVYKERPSEDVIYSLSFGRENYDMFVDFDGDRQTTGRKHIALSIEGWDHLKTKFLSKGEVALHELNAYHEWKEKDCYVFPAGTKIQN